MGTSRLANAGDVENVGHHRRGRGAGPGSRAVKHHLAHGIPFHQDRVVHPMHPGQGMALGQQGGVNTHIQLGGSVGGWAEVLGHGQQLHHVAQLGGIGHITGLKGVDAFGGYGGPRHAAPVGQGTEDGDLVGRIAPLHVGGGIGFGVAQLLGIGEDGPIGGPLIGHPAEDVIGGAVDDPAHLLDAVAAQGLLEGLNDGDSAPYGGLNQHVNALLGGGGGDLFAIAGNDSLVGRHHGFAGGDGPQDQAAGRLQATHHLHHDVDVGVIHHGVWVRGEELTREFDRSGPIQIPHGHPFQGKFSHQGVASSWTGEDGSDAGSHGAQAEQTDADGHGLVQQVGVILEISLQQGPALGSASA